MEVWGAKYRKRLEEIYPEDKVFDTEDLLKIDTD